MAKNNNLPVPKLRQTGKTEQFEKILFKAADKLRKNMDAVVASHVKYQLEGVNVFDEDDWSKMNDFYN